MLGKNLNRGRFKSSGRCGLAKKVASEQHWKIQHDNMDVKREEQIKITVVLKTQNVILLQQHCPAFSGVALASVLFAPAGTALDINCHSL